MRKWLVRLFLGTACLCLLMVIAVGGVLLYFSAGLPAFDSLEDYRPPQVSRLLDRKGRVIGALYEEKRTVVSIDRVPSHVQKAFLAAEDADFYRHPGLDFTGMLRALWRNLKAGRVVEGGSTITQQVIKTLLLGPERSYARKIREVLLALRLESNLTKDEILSLYLNQIYFGHRCYGVQEASRFYFGKDVDQLALWEGAVLASLPKSPAMYSPLRHPAKARQRRDWVLDQMMENGMAAAEEIVEAKEQPIVAVGRAANYHELAPYYAEYCRRHLEERLGHQTLYEGGLRIELALDLDLQRIARRAVQRGLRAVDRRQGFRGALGKLPDEQRALLHQRAAERAAEHEGLVWTLAPGTNKDGSTTWKANWVKPRDGAWLNVPVIAVEHAGKREVARVDLGTSEVELDLASMKWARSFSPVKKTPAPGAVSEVVAPGDVIEVEITLVGDGRFQARLSQPPLVQGALVAIDPESRDVLAMVGGSDFGRSPLIRAVQSRRQPGSAFKPLVYAAAVRTGAYTPTTIVMDTPEVYYSSLRGSTWKPRNFERVFVGPVSVRYALAHSINTVAVKIASDVGPDAIIDTAREMGIESELCRNLSLALGASEVTPLELTNAYATLAAQGKAAPPVFIHRVVGPNGEKLGPADDQETRQAITPAQAFVVTSLLRSVIEEGTGRRALRLGRPLAGKTGTANQQRDGWFVGYAPDLVTGVWVGFDDHGRMGTGWAQGAGTALPIWLEFMEKALEGRPRLEFAAPEGVVFARVDPENGLLAPPRMAGARVEVFVEGTEPRSTSEREPDESPGTDAVGAVPDERIPEGLYR